MSSPCSIVLKSACCVLLLTCTKLAAAQAKPELRQLPGGAAGAVLNTRQVQLKVPVGPQLTKVRHYDQLENWTGGDTKLYAGRKFNVDFVLSGLPGGFVNFEIDRSRYPQGSVSQWGTLGQPAAAGAEIRRDLEFLIEDAAVPADGVVHLHMLATITGNGSPKIIPFSREYVILTRMRRMLWTDTASRAEHANFQLFTSGSGSTCEGESWTPAATHPVGMTTRGNKLVFRVRSGPLGTFCKWKGTEQHNYVPYPWRIIAVNWSSRTSEHCEHPNVETSRPQSPPGSLRTDWLDVGNGRQVMKALHLPDNRLPVMLLSLHCKNTLLNDHFVETVWDSVEMEGPVDKDFNNIHW